MNAETASYVMALEEELRHTFYVVVKARRISSDEVLAEARKLSAIRGTSTLAEIFRMRKAVWYEKGV